MMTKDKTAQTEMPELKMVALSEIPQTEIKWLAKPYIAFGKITLVYGDGGMGKSSMMQSIMADVTNGRMFCETDLDAPGEVVYLNGEDSYPNTICPNLTRLGANCEMIHMIDDGEVALSLSDGRVEESVRRSNAKLLVIDPLQYVCSDVTSVSIMRPLLKRLGVLAEQTGCAVVIVTHFTKKGGRVQYRALGTIDTYAAARSVLTVGQMPLDPDTRVMIQIKNNLSPLGRPQAFGFDEQSGFTWLGDIDATVDEVVSGKPKEENQMEKARRFLENELTAKIVPAVEVMEKAEARGISQKTLNRAKTALGVLSIKRGGKWYWQLPIDAEVVDVVDGDDVDDVADNAAAIVNDEHRAGEVGRVTALAILENAS